MSIPVVAIGGVTELADVLDFLAVGAVAVQVGHGDLRRPDPARPPRRRAGRRDAPRAGPHDAIATSSARPCRARPAPRRPRAWSTGHEEASGSCRSGTGRTRRTRRRARRRTRSPSRSSWPRRSRPLGGDGAYFRVHHFARSSPRRSRCWPPSAPGPSGSRSAPRSSTCATRTRCTWPRTPARPTSSPAAACSWASAAARRSRSSTGSATSATTRPRARPTPTWPDAMPTSSCRSCAARASPSPTRGRCSRTRPALLRLEPHSPGLRDRIWWGAGTRATAEWTAQQGLNLMSSTLLTEDAGVPFHVLQAEQIQRFRDAWTAAGHEREPRVSVSRSIFPIVDDRDRMYFGGAARTRTTSATSTPRPRRRSGGRTPPSPTCSSGSSPRTRPSPRPTRCC